VSSFVRGNPLQWLIGKGGSLAEGFVPGFGLWQSDEAHNDFIRILHAYGIVGLTLYLGILYRLFGQARRLRRDGDAFSRSLGIVVLTIIPSIILLSLTTEPMRYPTAAWYLFALASTVEVKFRELQAGAGALLGRT